MKLRLLVALWTACCGAAAWATSKTTLLETRSTWDGAAIDYLRTPCPEVHAVIVEIPANGVTPIHLHPVNNFAYVLEGQVTVKEGQVVKGRLLAGKSSTFKKGDAFAEVVNRWHEGTAGPEGAKILVWYTGEVGRPVTVAYTPGHRVERATKRSPRCEPPRGP